MVRKPRRRADAVDIDASSPRPVLELTGFRMMLYLFLLFLLVVSDPFVDTVISGFGEEAVKGRTPTSWGVVLQGIFLVIGYSIIVYLGSAKVL